MTLPSDMRCTLSFGTGGIRERIGSGPSRLNSETIAIITQGYANYLKETGITRPIVVCHDTRHGSAQFSRIVCEVLAANGVQTFIFPEPTPTPVLSFAIPELGCEGGVVITASHNSKEYNGYKVYGANGCQITVNDACAIQRHIERVSKHGHVRGTSFTDALSSGSIQWAPDDLFARYGNAVYSCSAHTPCSNLRIAYTPLNGTGLKYVRHVLNRAGIAELFVVREQSMPNGNFPTCPKPNPEEPQALKLGIQLARHVDADLLLATDPDADRLGVAVPDKGDWRILSGNEVGLLLLNHLASTKMSRGLSHMVALTTIVSSPIADDIASTYGFELRRTLTGFKFIGEQMSLLKAGDRDKDFLFAFEESCGYLAGTYALDKDGVEACLLICELAAHLKTRGQTLIDELNLLHKRYGSWAEAQISITYGNSIDGNSFSKLIPSIKASLPHQIAKRNIEHVLDYSLGLPMPIVNALPDSQTKVTLPPSNVLEMRLAGGSRILIRPSGTEPKVKAYFFVRGSSQSDAEKLLETIVASVHDLLAQVISNPDS